MNRYKLITTIVFLVVLLLINFDIFHNSEKNNYVNVYNRSEEIVIVYLGSSKCQFCSDPVFIENFKSEVNFIKNVIDSLDIGFNTIGVAIDIDVENGFSFLNNTYDFKEIAIGNGFNNSNIYKFIWDYKVPLDKLVTPHLILIKRTYSPIDSLQSSFLKIDRDSIITRQIGFNSPILVKNEFLKYLNN